MKKIYTLLLLFTITLFYSIPTQAYTINDLDVEISILNNLTLREVFIDGQLIANPSFENDINGWLTFNSVNTYVNNNLINTAGLAANNARVGTLIVASGNIGDIYYSTTKFRILNTSAASFNYAIGHIDVGLFGNGFANSSITSPIINQYYNISLRGVSTTTAAIRTRLLHTYSTNLIADGKEAEIEYAYAYNLTTLGLTSLTQQQLDYWFNEFIIISAFIEGYNEGILASEAYAVGFGDGYDVGYGDGYQDAVEEDNAYSLGYAKGLLEGGDMETGSSLLILIVAAIGFIMMIFGFATKRRIFNLLSVGAFIVLGGLLAEFVGFIIITVGLVFVNVYYTFFGDI
jgi:hypothetical protein